MCVCTRMPVHRAGTLFLESWKRLCNALVRQWGVLGVEDVEEVALVYCAGSFSARESCHSMIAQEMSMPVLRSC